MCNRLRITDFSPQKKKTQPTNPNVQNLKPFPKSPPRRNVCVEICARTRRDRSRPAELNLCAAPVEEPQDRRPIRARTEFQLVARRGVKLHRTSSLLAHSRLAIVTLLRRSSSSTARMMAGIKCASHIQWTAIAPTTTTTSVQVAFSCFLQIWYVLFFCFEAP